MNGNKREEADKMNKIILLGNVTRNPKRTLLLPNLILRSIERQSRSQMRMRISFIAPHLESRRNLSRDIFTVALVYWLLGGYRTIIIQPKREARFMDSVSLQKRLSLHRRKVRKNRKIKKVIFHLLQMRINHSMAGR